MDFKHISHIYFLGIGGIGMSALARYFNSIGKVVAGYDKTPTELTRNLQNEGINIIFEDNEHLLPEWLQPHSEQVLVIYTPAVPGSLGLFNKLNNGSFHIVKRAMALAAITQNHFTIAVAGTHGKTTTSTYLAHLLMAENVSFAAFLGGISVNYNSNYVCNNTSNSQTIVVEADEFDRSFLHLKPNISIITSCEADHLDIYGSYEEVRKAYNEFANCLSSGGLLILHESLRHVFHLRSDIEVVYYGKNGDITYENEQVKEGRFVFDLPAFNMQQLQNGLPGVHNILNATAAVAAVQRVVAMQHTAEAIRSFSGIKRRFETIYKSDENIYIDDYAHHPSEIKAALQAARQLFPNLQLTVVFQPHLYSRTRDFAEDFKKELANCDQLYVLPIYPARELPIEGVTSALILPEKNAQLVGFDDILDLAKNNAPQLLLTLGAGNIDLLVAPLRTIFQTKKIADEK
ncbi:UDP-N-acetylmuramate--L-alanine ligase [bacterium]|nr:UDP-N-acetylmuramate--L-alanine ligase [bacterium]